MADPSVIATTDRLILRPWRVDEADRFLDIYRRVEVVRWLSGKPMRDRREAVERIEQTLKRLAEDPRFGSWAVVDRSTGTPAGTVLLKPLPDGEGEAEIGWHLHPDCQGQGLASESGRALLERGFSHGLTEVWAVTKPDNNRSAAVCLRIGMRLLGVTDRWYHEPSLMFWTGRNRRQQPSLRPDEPAPAAATHHADKDDAPGRHQSRLLRASRGPRR